MPSITTSKEYKQYKKQIAKKTRKKLGLFKYLFKPGVPAEIHKKAMKKSAKKILGKTSNADVKLAKRLLYGK